MLSVRGLDVARFDELVDYTRYINPVAWFIFKCTLDYPRRLAGATLRSPISCEATRSGMHRHPSHRCLQGRPSAAERMSETIPSIPDGGVADADASHSRMS